MTRNLILNPFTEALRRLMPAAGRPEVHKVYDLEREFQLDKILVILGRPPEGREAVRLLTGRLSLGRARFQTRDPVEVGERLQLQMLLSQGITLCTPARVESVEEMGDGQRQGVVSLSLTPLEQGMLNGYLNRRGRRVS